jgi:AAA domain
LPAAKRTHHSTAGASPWAPLLHLAQEHGADFEQWRDLEQEPQPNESPVGLNFINAGTDDWNVGPRGWLLGNVFCREFVSSLLGDGAVGKTALRYAQYLSLATGKPLTGEYVFVRSRVLLISLEDGLKELRRRIKAACLRHGIEQRELDGWLYYVALGAKDGKLMILDKRGRAIPGSLGSNLEHSIVELRPDLLALDPFVKTHGVDENNNSAIDDVVQILTDMTDRHTIAIDIPHHVSKGPADPGNADRGRGASAMKDAARLVCTLTPMTTDEAKDLGVDEAERRFLRRMDGGKVNIAPPAIDAIWFRLVGVPLGNGSETYPHGDIVQTVERWTPPDIWRDMSALIIQKILNAIEAGLPNGDRYSDSARAKERAAWQLVVEHCPDKTDEQAKQIIVKWLKSGLLIRRDYTNKKRQDAKGLFVNNSKRPI